MNRISTYDVLSAYEETGLHPICSETLVIRFDGCHGCALTALAAQKLGALPTCGTSECLNPWDAADILELDEEYTKGFINGFDGSVGDLLLYQDGGKITKYELGHFDGTVAHLAVFGN